VHAIESLDREAVFMYVLGFNQGREVRGQTPRGRRGHV